MEYNVHDNRVLCFFLFGPLLILLTLEGCLTHDGTQRKVFWVNEEAQLLCGYCIALYFTWI